MCGCIVLAACGRGGGDASSAGTGAGEGATAAASGAGAPGAAAGAPPSGAAANGGGGLRPATSPANAPDGEARARAARDAASGWPKVEGRWTRGDTDSRYVAHFDGGQLRYLLEEMSLGDRGSRRNEYWFNGGELYYYVGEKPSAYGGTGPGALPPTVPVVAEFRGAEVVRAISREHYGEKKLDDEALAGIRRHAAALAGAAQDEWSARSLK
jgi:hypothetical protein